MATTRKILPGLSDETDMERLVTKVLENDPSETRLIRFIEKEASRIILQSQRGDQFTSFDKVAVTALSDIVRPEKHESSLMLIDNHYRYVASMKIPMDMTTEDIVREIIADPRNDKATQLIHVINADESLEADINIKRIKDIKLAAECLQLNMLDTVIVNKEDTFEHGQPEYQAASVTDKSERFIMTLQEANTLSRLNEIREVPKEIDGWNKFIKEYVKRDLIGKHVVDDQEEIETSLVLALNREYKEHFVVIGYDTMQRISSVDIVSRGSQTEASVDMREIARILAPKDTKGVVLCHNHPSGDIEPSEADFSITGQINTLADVLHKNVPEHFIVGSGRGITGRLSNQMPLLKENFRREVMTYKHKDAQRINEPKESKARPKITVYRPSPARVRSNER